MDFDQFRFKPDWERMDFSGSKRFSTAAFHPVHECELGPGANDPPTGQALPASRAKAD